MDKEIAIQLAYINLNSLWNKFEFRKRLEPKRAEGIAQQQDELEQIKAVLNTVIKENRALSNKLMSMQIELLETQKKLTDYKETYD
jgi:hypothetical protein